ncbi:hypothetical protein NSQ95_07770 [Psychrobacillus sp. FSL W7-1457]|uniref:hypothetical protein n=1 Tax=Psychrobacillus sp. FSL W7-1457 TaxID=2954547 RepID=UPI00315A4841
METKEMIHTINDCMEKLDYITVRKYIIDNIHHLNLYKHLLDDATLNVLQYLNTTIDSEPQPVSRQEVAIIYSINMYSKMFDVRSLRMKIKENPSLLMRQDIRHYFNEESKTLLEGMRVISNHANKV